MKITQDLLDDLTALAKASLRLRMNFDLRNSPADTSQRMLNAIEPGSKILVHRHRKTSETFVILRGRIEVDFYDENSKKCIESIELSPNGTNVAINIPIDRWHTVRSLESGTVILSAMNGPYEPPQAKDILKI